MGGEDTNRYKFGLVKTKFGVIYAELEYQSKTTSTQKFIQLLSKPAISLFHFSALLKSPQISDTGLTFPEKTVTKLIAIEIFITG
jgi:hypothetical protein